MARLGVPVLGQGVPGGVFDVSSGAVWRRGDLHLHSPGVKVFRYPNGADTQSEAGRRRIVQAYVRQLKAVGIEIGAITDYNGIHSPWFKSIQEEAANDDILIFPGVELSIATGKHGLHILAVFETDADVESINRFLLTLDQDGVSPLIDEDGNHRDIELRTNLREALKNLRERFKCLLIPSHPDDHKGICRSFAPGDAARYLQSMEPDALEYCPKETLNRLRNTALLEPGFLERLALVEFSDAHSIEEIGTKQRDSSPRATHLKLSATDLDAVRLALHDPETRIAIGTVPEVTHARFIGMEVQGSGFLGNMVVHLNDDLNALIGGRGAGKSAIIETMRYALDLRPYSDESYRLDLVRHALGSGGKVTVFVERPTGQGTGRRYRIVRILGEDPRVEDAEAGSLVSIRPLEVFRPSFEPVILGQREIQSVSADETYRLRLIDDLIGEAAQRVAREVGKAREVLEANARAILEAARKLQRRAEYDERLKALQFEIDIYEKQGVADKLRTHTDLSADGKALHRAYERVGEESRAWAELGQNLEGALETLAFSLRGGRSVHAEVLHLAANEIDRLSGQMKHLVRQGADAFADTVKKLADLQERWQELLRPLEEDLLRARRTLHSEILDPDRLLRLTEERSALLPLLKELDTVEEHLNELRLERKGLLHRFRDLRHDLHVLRRKRCEAVENRLKGRLRISVKFKENKEDYRRALAAVFKGSGVTAEAQARLVAPEATDGIALAEAVRAGVEEVQKRFELTPGMAQKIVEWLRSDESRFLHLETLIPPDSVSIELVVDDNPRPLDRLSIGQRATAILLLLFALEGRPLILDQPEDDLDNRFVYEDVVALLREEKGLTQPGRRRQIIAATHNANIPVLGDAELVLALEARDGRAQIVGRASIDDRMIREQVRTLLEGGEEAFRRRAEKYGGMIWT